MGNLRVFCFILVAMSWFLMGSTAAMSHVVGGRSGWTVSDNLTFYADWAKPRTFGVSDKLVFPYRSGSDNVVEVIESDYESCAQDQVINMYFLGPTILDLSETGDRYFYSGIGKHCENGEKLHVTVVNSEGSSGSDPLPFKTENIGVEEEETSSGSDPLPFKAENIGDEEEEETSSVSPPPVLYKVAAKLSPAASASSVAELGFVSLFAGFLLLLVVRDNGFDREEEKINFTKP